jgi:hypothetical protein
MGVTTIRSLALLPALCLVVHSAVAAAPPPVADEPERARLRAWVEQMKEAPRGPFARIRWFCADGTVREPRPFACKDHGGGVQHGELNERARTLRERGYHIANLLAAVDAKALLSETGHRDAIAQLLIEQFLINIDDGWILRQARFYRGALQEEDERRGARELLLALVASDAHLERDFLLLRTAAQLLSHGVETPSAGRVRRRSAALSDRDHGFLELRNKIHVRPEPTDAAAVRAYAARVDEPALRAELEALAGDIDALYAASSPADALRALARQSAADTAIHRVSAQFAGKLDAAADAPARFATLARALAALREALPTIRSARIRLSVIDTGLALESDLFVAAAALAESLAVAARATRLGWLGAGAEAAYGTGLASARQRAALTLAADRLARATVPLADYKRELGYLALLPSWGAQRVRLHFGEAMQTLADIEPKATRFVEDHLRASPLFFYAQVLDGMLRDANRLAGVRNELFGSDVGSGLRALNPGLARGRLLASPAAGEAFASDGIYVLPETVAELPPVAGILTAGAGNPLSHVQLLARNLGIPNVGIDEALLPTLQPHFGRDVVLAVSAAGSVRLTDDAGEAGALFAAGAADAKRTLIRPDLDKLDLSTRDLLRLSELRAEDSGRSVGPKAAKLGELKHRFPDAVADGLAIPFGVFRAMLEQPHAAGGGTVFEWMQSGYRALEAMPAGSAERAAATEALRRELYAWVLNADPGEVFRARLRETLAQVFGADGSYGVFVRSDTNVEDLPGFTGAGLNLTVPNVVGVDRVIEALSRVWASPFTERAFAWRQAYMDQPEHVYPAILLLLSVNANKSGVMVTHDIDSGDPGWLSVAVNEGVGGAVDGQAAESLRIDMATGEARLLAQATAVWRRRVDPSGGVDKVLSSGSDRVLQAGEIAQLIELARVLPQRFPAIVDADGNPAPADIEFGFLDGQLKLFQIRPFLESRQARGNAYLTSLDAAMADLDAIQVSMSEVPR